MPVLVRGEGKAAISERRVEIDWATSEACCALVFDLLAILGELKVGLVQTHDSTVSEATAITELVTVVAVRTSDSGGEACDKYQRICLGLRIEVPVCVGHDVLQELP